RTEPEAASVGKREKIGERPFDDSQSMLDKPQLADHLGVEQAHGIGGRGVAKAGREFLGDRRAADDGAALEHPYLEAGAGEIAGADEAVVSAADDDDIVRH